MYLATHTECENREKHLKNRSVTNTSQSTWPLKTEAIPNVYFAKMSNADFNLSKYTYTSRLKLILSESDFYAFCRAALSKSAKFCFFRVGEVFGQDGNVTWRMTTKAVCEISNDILVKTNSTCGWTSKHWFPWGNSLIWQRGVDADDLVIVDS